MKRLLGTVAAVAALALAAGCGGNSGNDAGSGSGSSPSGTSGGVTGTVTVFAAASLTESFTTLGKQFEAAHPGTTVKFNFGASSSLAENINQGAPADVFASASSKNMKQVVDAGGASDSKTFANNVMQIAVPPDNPANVSQVTDLANPKHQGRPLPAAGALRHGRPGGVQEGRRHGEAGDPGRGRKGRAHHRAARRGRRRHGV